MFSPFIHVRSGKEFHYAQPVEFDIHLGDIAHHLSINNRFCGATEYPYSVAQHAVNVANIVKQMGFGLTHQLQALHHDDHEAYISDIPTPCQIWLTARNDGIDVIGPAKEHLDVSIYSALDVPYPNTSTSDMIARADKTAFVLEAQSSNLFTAPRPWLNAYIDRYGIITSLYTIDTREMSFREAKASFLTKHAELHETSTWR